MKHGFKFMAWMLCLALASTIMASDIVVQHGVDETMPIALGGQQGVQAPQLIAHSVVHPKRPKMSSSLNAPSKVTLALVVRADGSVGRIEPMAVQHPGMGFEAEAVRALQNWKYKPAVKEGESVNSLDVVTIVFPEQSNELVRGELPLDHPGRTNMLLMSTMLGEKPGQVIGVTSPLENSPALAGGTFVTKAGIINVKEGQLYNRNPPDPETGPTDNGNFINVPPNVSVRPGG